MEETLPSFNSWSYIYGKGILGDNTGRQVLKQSRNEEEWGIEDSKKKKNVAGCHLGFLQMYRRINGLEITVKSKKDKNFSV